MYLSTSNDIIQLRFTYENQAAISSAIQNFGHLIDLSKERQQPTSTSPIIQIQRPRFSSPVPPYSAAPYATTVPHPRCTQEQLQIEQCKSMTIKIKTESIFSFLVRHLEDLYYSRGSAPPRATLPFQTFAYRPVRSQFSGSIDNPFVDLNFAVPARTSTSSYTASWDPQSAHRSSSIFGPNPFINTNSQSIQRLPAPSSESSSRRNQVTSTTAARSLEGDERPIFGGGGRVRNRVNSTAVPRQEQAPPPLPPPLSDLQRRGTFVLDEPSLPNLPQSGAQRPRDTVNIQDLYNVRARDRAQTPVAFTIDLNETSQPASSEAATSDTT